MRKSFISQASCISGPRAWNSWLVTDGQVFLKDHEFPMTPAFKILTAAMYAQITAISAVEKSWSTFV